MDTKMMMDMVTMIMMMVMDTMMIIIMASLARVGRDRKVVTMTMTTTMESLARVPRVVLMNITMMDMKL